MSKQGTAHAIKNHFVAFLGEFVGTFLFLFFAFAGTQTANTPSTQEANLTGPDLTQLLYISLVFGFSLAINVWIFFRISGGLFNPAVTLALCITGNVPMVRSIFVFVAQIIAGITAAAAVNGLIPGNNVYFAVHLTSGTSVAQGLFLEMFFTVELVFTILMLAAEKTKATFIAPVGIGLALFVAELVGVFWTGGSVNPARAFGPAVIQGDFDGYHWLYWIGPLLGSLLASAFYAIFKVLNYEEVNGNQDKSKREMERDRDGDADGERDGEERDLELGRRMGSRGSRRGGSLSNGNGNEMGNGVRKSGGGNGGGGGNRRDRPDSQPSRRSQRSQRSQGAGRNGYGYGNGNTNTNRNSNVDSRDRDGRPRSQRISGSYLSGNMDGDGNWGWSLSGNGNENGNGKGTDKERKRETGLGLGLGNGNGNGIEIGNGKGIDIGKGLELKEGLGSWRL